jgi:hypothetical protein
MVSLPPIFNGASGVLFGTAIIIALRHAASVWYTLAFVGLAAFGRRRRKAYGVIYDAVTKKPVNLANVNLMDAKTGRRVQTAATDFDGRFAFFMPPHRPGTFRIHVVAAQYAFPSKIVTARHFDGGYADISHGEDIVIGNDGDVIAVNIPLDPESPAQAMASAPTGFSARTTVLLIAAIVPYLTFFSAATYADLPLLLMGVVEAGCLLFVTVGPPRKVKYWGLVRDALTRKPIAQAIVRLFHEEMDKVIASVQADEKGRYSFIAGHGNLYVIAEKPGYVLRERVPVRIAGSQDRCVIIDSDIVLYPASSMRADYDTELTPENEYSS